MANQNSIFLILASWNRLYWLKVNIFTDIVVPLASEDLGCW